MDVDETRTDEESFDIYDSVSFFFVDSANFAYSSIFQRNICVEPRATGTVQDPTIF